MKASTKAKEIMMIRRLLFTFAGAALLLAMGNQTLWAAGGGAQNTGKCGRSSIANGPFTYSPENCGSATFLGSAGDPQTTSFIVTAPNATGDNVVFPGEGQNSCLGQAEAAISALEITKVADADGNPLDPTVSLDSTSPLFNQIAGAFGFVPTTNTFTPGSSVTVNVTISNPLVGSADFGQYLVKMAARAPGAGIGVGPGCNYALNLQEFQPLIGDLTPPTVTVVQPAGDQILGVIPVEITAIDPEPGTGVASMSTTVSSAGGTVLNQPISLTLDQILPVAPGVLVTGTGTFTPTGGTGPSGTTDALAFNSVSRSGIGSYTLNAEAIDGAGNTGFGSKSFIVNYAVAFSQAFAPPPCASRIGNSGLNCTGMFKFTVNRSNVTSDGAFLFDHTVVVELVRKSDGIVMATHAFGTGDIKYAIQIDATIPEYKTNFKRGDLIGPPTSASIYVGKVYFLDVDGNWVLQGTSPDVTF